MKPYPMTLVKAYATGPDGERLDIPDLPNVPVEYVMTVGNSVLVVFERHGERTILAATYAPERIAPKDRGTVCAIEVRRGTWEGPEPFPMVDDDKSREMTRMVKGQTVKEIRAHVEGLTVWFQTALVAVTPQGAGVATFTPNPALGDTARPC